MDTTLALLFVVLVGAAIVAIAGAYVLGSPARVALSERAVKVSLRWPWPLLALRRSLVIPRAAIRAASVVDDARPLLRGVRVGTYVPGGPIAGRFLSAGTTDFWAVRNHRALVLDLEGSSFARVVVETDDADEIARTLAVGGAELAASSPPSAPARLSATARALGLALAGVGCALPVLTAALASGSLPNPVATHWGSAGGSSAPDGHLSLWTVTFALSAISAAGCAPAVWALVRGALRPGAFAFASFVMAVSVSVLGTIIAANWSEESWRAARQPGWSLASIVVAPGLVAYVTYRATRTRRD